MPDGIEIKVKGVNETVKSIYSYGSKIGDKVIIASLKEGARIVQKQAKRNAPKRTGRLRRGIVIKVSKINKPHRRKGMIGIYLTLRKGKGKKDKKDAFYGRYIEDGWTPAGRRAERRSQVTSVFGKRTGRKTRDSGKRIQGVRYMKRAFNTRKLQAVSRIKRSLVIAEKRIRKSKGLD